MHNPISEGKVNIPVHNPISEGKVNIPVSALAV